jgi:DNA polymerase I-like protein with 3'-5' exonuclease and polymerase domains
MSASDNTSRPARRIKGVSSQAALPEVRERVRALMTGVASLKVPLEVEVGAGPNWEQAH